MTAILNLPRACALILCCLLGFSTALHAQWRNNEDAGFRYGDYTVFAGVGYGMDYGFSPSGIERPAFALMMDRGAIEIAPGTIGFGAILAYKEAEQTINEGRISSAWSCVTAAARATFHVTALSRLLPEVDLYGGVMGGVQYWHYTDNYSEAMGLAHKERGARPVSAPFLGLKCNLTKAVGIWAEAGWDVAALKGGVHVNF